MNQEEFAKWLLGRLDQGLLPDGRLTQLPSEGGCLCFSQHHALKFHAICLHINSKIKVKDVLK